MAGSKRATSPLSDDEGFVKIVDRAKDLVKSGGEWISSVDIENTLMGHPAVKEAAVVGVPHPKWQERPLAAVVLKDGAQATPEELRAFPGSDLRQVAAPRRVRFRRSTYHAHLSANSKRPRFANNSPDWNWDQ